MCPEVITQLLYGASLILNLGITQLKLFLQGRATQYIKEELK